jgi:hypothetical protein
MLDESGAAVAGDFFFAVVKRVEKVFAFDPWTMSVAQVALRNPFSKHDFRFALNAFLRPPTNSQCESPAKRPWLMKGHPRPCVRGAGLAMH